MSPTPYTFLRYLGLWLGLLTLPAFVGAQCSTGFNVGFNQTSCSSQLSLQSFIGPALPAGAVASDFSILVSRNGADVEAFTFATLTGADLNLDGTVSVTGLPASTYDLNGQFDYSLTQITASVSTVCTGSFGVQSSDMMPPTIAPQAVLSAIDCFESLPAIDASRVTDNCDASPTITMGALQFSATDYCAAQNSMTATVVATRTFTATDDAGNVATGSQQVTINVQPAALATIINDIVPDNITYTCDQYAANNGITDNAAISPTVVNADVDGSTTNGSITVNPNLNVATITTGAGTLANQGGFCQYMVVSVEDDTLALCNASTRPFETFKIVREFVIMDACSFATETAFQTITVTDPAVPTIAVSGPITIGTNSSTSCTSTGLIAAPAVTVTGCSALDQSATTASIAGVGMLNPIFSAGVLIGFQSPVGLAVGSYTVDFSVATVCGQSASSQLSVTVVDRTPPVAECDEITNLSLTNTTTTSLFANTLDDGSRDGCSPQVYFKILRMDELAAGNGVSQGVTTTCGNANADVGTNISLFDDSAAFCCEDAATGSNVMVVVYVFDVDPGAGPVTASRFGPTGDLFGRYNQCMVEVEVEEKLPPTLISSPPARTIACTDDASVAAYTDQANSDFDAPIFTDACNFTVALTSIVTSSGFNKCGGTITRTFVATDDNGNSSAPVTQTITVTGAEDYTIPFPADRTVTTCTSGSAGGVLTGSDIVNQGCSIVGVNLDSSIFTINGSGTCRKILRTYSTLSCCATSLTGPLVPLETIIGNRPLGVSIRVANDQVFVNGVLNSALTSAYINAGRTGFTYTQSVDINDSTPPVVAAGTAPSCSALDVIDINGVCGQSVRIPFTAIDACSAAVPSVSVVDANGAAISPAPTVAVAPDATVPGGFTATVDLPIGSYQLVVTATDGCGNTAAGIRIPFTAQDCKEPTPVAITNISTVVMQASGMVPFSAVGVNNGSFDDCGPVTFSIKRIGEPFSAAGPNVILNCGDLNPGSGITPVPLTFIVSDASNNVDSVVVFVNLRDAIPSACGTQPRSLSGTIKTSRTQSLAGARMAMSGGMTANAVTASNGGFEFANLDLGSDVTVSASHNLDPKAGVTANDLYWIGQHLLRNATFVDPVTLLAADANASGRVSAFDLTVIRRVILGLDGNYRDNESYRFIDANYTFPQPANPWAEVFPEVLSFNDISADVTGADFLAIKIGDVNGSINAARGNLAPRHFAGELALVSQEAVATETPSVVGFSASQADALGYQATLEWDPSQVKVLEVIGGTHVDEGFGTHLLKEGKLTLVHTGAVGGELFSLRVRSLNGDRPLAELFRLTDAVTPVEAFSAAGSYALNLRFAGQEAAAVNALAQNSPNPFAGQTQISFSLAQDGPAEVSIADANGRVIWRTAGNWTAGSHTLDLDAADLSANGVLSYTLKAGEFSATRRMVVIK